MQTCVDGIGLQLINQFIRVLKSRSGLLRNNLGLPITGTNCSSSSILLSDFDDFSRNSSHFLCFYYYYYANFSRLDNNRFFCYAIK